MPVLLWDASALIKRYAPEVGSDAVDALFVAAPRPPMIATFWTYVETCAGILRKRNRGEIGVAAFQTALTALQGEVLTSPDVPLLTIENSDILGGLQYLYSQTSTRPTRHCSRRICATFGCSRPADLNLYSSRPISVYARRPSPRGWRR